ncbi:MAG: Ig-like domain-containing protein [Deltaproteobacteria bacterium]|nr:MAG: Ig-like domain-containing protein [Deltaproteobacteria bacterium]
MEVEIPEMRVVVTGSSAVVVGETLTLSVETIGTDDSGYTWSSADETVATVDADGVVTGVSAGEVVITATGNDSDRAGTHNIVVVPPDADPGELMPYYYEQWSRSAHSDGSSEAFVHWGTEAGGEIPADCARCHSSTGFQDYLGADGSAFQVVDNAAPVGTTVNCATCHNSVAKSLDVVQFPSGVEIEGLGREAICMTCHQGRASSDTVEQMIVDADADAAPDTKNDALRFTNIHYYAAGATLEAGRVRGGYQYAGKTYDWRFRHVPGYDSCIGCHDQHTLQVKVDECSTCHTEVAAIADLRKIRMIASVGRDFDGDGDVTEGIYHELGGMRDNLMAAIQDYTIAQGLAAICYDGSAYPYWFLDTDGNGECNGDEAKTTNQFREWTARLTRAAYNYQVSLKDPGAFAHNAKYMFQLLYDSVEDVGGDVSAMVRDDFGHFNGASEAARHWDGDEAVSASCSKCHGGADGFRYFLANGASHEVTEQANGLDCTTCHAGFAPDNYALVTVESVTFPNGVTLDAGSNDSNMCSTCHSGRESKASVDAKIAGGNFGFSNIHYLPAGATRLGTAAQVGYEFDGMDYAGPWVGHAGGDGCNDCHSGKLSNHTFDVKDVFAAEGGCATCHGNVDDVEMIRGFARKDVDFDDDGDFAEPLKGEISGLADRLLVAMQAYAVDNGIAAPCYEGHTYPYFFVDTDGNGSCDATEAVYANQHKAFDASLARVAFNFQFAQKEPGAWAHNFDYMAQLLIDSIAHVGGDTTGLVRP